MAGLGSQPEEVVELAFRGSHAYSRCGMPALQDHDSGGHDQLLSVRQSQRAHAGHQKDRKGHSVAGDGQQSGRAIPMDQIETQILTQRKDARGDRSAKKDSVS